MSIPLLFEPLTSRGHTFRNRLWVSPMCQYSAVDGMPQDWHLVHLGSFAVGGAGLVMAEATAVSPEGRISPACTGIWNDAQQEAWSRIAAFIRSQGTQAGIQIAHAGRKGSTRPLGETPGAVDVQDGGWVTVAPSASPYGSLPVPHALNRDEIDRVIADFARAAKRAEAAGFTVVEVHAAHGYLLHEFLSPLSNQRHDEYGGDFPNRTRMLLKVVEAVRAALSPGTALFVRLSATDWVEGGWTLEQTVELVPLLEERGVDLIDVSSAGLDPRQSIPVGPGYQVALASAVKAMATVPVSAVGLLRSPEEFEGILRDRHADVVFAGREFLRDRMLPLRAARDLGAEFVWPRQYKMAKFAGSIP
jgi:2,4-dienoyl-CoA reductase-like NADH-dependent reductase (Old Yellow Enzyme family)